MTNSADPDQLASSEANRSGSTLFPRTGPVVFSKRRVKVIQRSWKAFSKGDQSARKNITLVLLNSDIPYLYKQWRSKSEAN